MVTAVPPRTGPPAGLIPVTTGALAEPNVKWSLAAAALVPPGVTTRTSTVPATWAGLMAVMWLSLITVGVVPMPPKLTEVAPVKPLPNIVTSVPPEVGPVAGLTAVTVGPEPYVNWSAEVAVLVPADVVTVTSTTPATWAGLMTEIELSLFTTGVAGLPPKLTEVAPVNPLPVMFTVVPPPMGPEAGLTWVTAGRETAAAESTVALKRAMTATMAARATSGRLRGIDVAARKDRNMHNAPSGESGTMGRDGRMGADRGAAAVKLVSPGRAAIPARQHNDPSNVPS